MLLVRFTRAGAVEAEVRLEQADLRVGRASDNEIALQDPDKTLSRHHAELRREGDRWVYLDLNSANGSWVGEHRVMRQELLPGIVVTLGDYHLTMTRVDASLDETAAPGDATQILRRDAETLRPTAAAKPAPSPSRPAAGAGRGRWCRWQWVRRPPPRLRRRHRRRFAESSFTDRSSSSARLPSCSLCCCAPPARRLPRIRLPRRHRRRQCRRRHRPTPHRPHQWSRRLCRRRRPSRSPRLLRSHPLPMAKPSPVRDSDPDAATIPARPGETAADLQQRRADVRRRYALALQRLAARQYAEARDLLTGLSQRGAEIPRSQCSTRRERRRTAPAGRR